MQLSSFPFDSFHQEIIPDDLLVHKGIFNPDLSEFYYTLSDKGYQKFDIFHIQKIQGKWRKPKKAFFNSEFSDHGMCFSLDGNTIYFSSTRPTGIDGVSQTWHIWRSIKKEGKWTKPEFVDIPNLREKLVSHPTLSGKGKLFFHSSNLDYSNMQIFQAREINEKFGPAIKTEIGQEQFSEKCTPYVSPDEDYLLFAAIGRELDLMISFNDGKGNWINTRKLSDKTKVPGQGNPWVSLDNKFLIYTSGGNNGSDWRIRSLDIESELEL